METLAALIGEHRRAIIRWGIPGVLAVFSAGLLARTLTQDGPPARKSRSYGALIDVVHSGHAAKAKSGERINYAGIRAPYPNEPFYNEARERNVELVESEMVRLRFDEEERDRKGRLFAYVFVQGEFVNEILVAEGLAYVRVTPKANRYAERLLAAQAEARKARLGIWQNRDRHEEPNYPSDPKYGNFHRPTCEEVGRINPARLIVFPKREKALDTGLAPCSKCLP